MTTSSYGVSVPVVPVEREKKSSMTCSPPPDDIDEYQISQLMEQGFTRGLARSLASNNRAFQTRIWVVDNSTSMKKADGHRIVDTANRNYVKIVSSTRWEEIRECVSYHIHMAGLLRTPTRFRLLNNPGASVGPQEFGIAEIVESIPDDEHKAMAIMHGAHPRGCTPLTYHIQEIHMIVSSMADELRREGRKVAIVIATDGLPTNEHGVGGSHVSQQFVESLRMLEGLPVWVVIRLCTDEDHIVNFYNELDEHLELSLEVLDDFCGEAAEVYEHNPWLNYALPLHRCREMGYHHRVFDLIDERKLTTTELREFMELLFGEDNFDGVPDPAVDWMGFSHTIEKLMRQEKPQWNPMSKILTPWIDMRKLERIYGGGGCIPGCIMM